TCPCPSVEMLGCARGHVGEARSPPTERVFGRPRCPINRASTGSRRHAWAEAGRAPETAGEWGSRCGAWASDATALHADASSAPGASRRRWTEEPAATETRR